MAEYIERKKAVNAVRNVWLGVQAINRIKSADVEPVRHGRWIKEHMHRGGFHRYTGLDDMGEQHTITVDERFEYDDLYCSECGKQSADNFLNYCSNCGAKMDLRGDDNDL